MHIFKNFFAMNVGSKNVLELFPGLPGILAQSLDLAWQAHLSHQVLTTIFTTTNTPKAQNEPLPSQTQAPTNLNMS